MFPAAGTEELCITSVNAIEYIVIAYTEKTVAPKMFFRLNSMAPAISCAVAPKNKTQGIINDFEGRVDTNCKSEEARTNAATAKPINPKAAGSATGKELIETSECAMSFCSIDVWIFFRFIYFHFSQ